MQLAVQEHLDRHPDHVLARLDWENAFNTISREVIFEALLALPDGQGAELLCITNMLYGESAAVLIFFRSDGSTDKILGTDGVTQGCPL